MQGGLSARKGLADKPSCCRRALRLGSTSANLVQSHRRRRLRLPRRARTRYLQKNHPTLHTDFTGHYEQPVRGVPARPGETLDTCATVWQKATLDLGAGSIWTDFLGFTRAGKRVVDATLAAGVLPLAAVTCDTDYPEIFLTGYKNSAEINPMADIITRRSSASNWAKAAYLTGGIGCAERESLLPVAHPAGERGWRSVSRGGFTV